MAVKDKDLYFMCWDLLRNLFFMDRLKATVMELVLSIAKLFSFIFLSLYLFCLVKKSSTSSSFIIQIFFFQRSRSCLTFQLFNLDSCIRYKNVVNKAETKAQLKKWHYHCSIQNRMICLQITIPTKCQGINTQPMKIKTNKYTRRLIYTRETLLKLKRQKTEHDRAQNRH